MRWVQEVLILMLGESTDNSLPVVNFHSNIYLQVIETYILYSSTIPDVMNEP
jgi:hypothetical protein